VIDYVPLENFIGRAEMIFIECTRLPRDRAYGSFGAAGMIVR
jgi:hypothetical protein